MRKSDRFLKSFRFLTDRSDITTIPASWTGKTRRSDPQDVPVLNLFVGLNWQPPAYPRFLLCVADQYEYWRNLRRLSTTTSRGELSDQGVLLRTGCNG